MTQNIKCYIKYKAEFVYPQVAKMENVLTTLKICIKVSRKAYSHFLALRLDAYILSKIYRNM